MKRKPRKKTPLAETNPELKKLPDALKRQFPAWMLERKSEEMPAKRPPVPLAERIAKAMKDSPDGVVRLDVPEKHLHSVCSYLQTSQNAGRIGAFLRVSNADPARLKIRLWRIAVFPVGWKNPAKPLRVRFFDDAADDEAEEKASRYVAEQVRKGFFARIVSPMMDFKANPVVFLDDDECCKRRRLWTVEVWKPGEYLKFLATDFSQVELLDAMQKHIASARREQFSMDARQASGVAKIRANKDSTAEKQRALFNELREQHGPGVKKEWLLRKVCDAHKRKRGWKMRTVKRNLKGR